MPEAFAQCGASYCGTNLVPNPDFEKTIDPPCSGNANDNQLWLDSSPLQGWFGTSCRTCQGNGITPDNFNSGCGGNGTFTCDQSKGSVGFYTYTGSGDAREYVQAKLIAPLKAGKKYCVEMDVRNQSSAKPCDGLGVYFSNKIYDLDKDNGGNSFFAFTPQVEQPKGVKIDACTKFSQSFCAKGDETSIMIGNFRNDANTTIESGGLFTIGYLIIDNVSVREVCETNPLQLLLTASPDSIICGGTSALTLTATGGNGTYTYHWINPAGTSGAGPVNVTPDSTTTYRVAVTTEGTCGSYTDTVAVTVVVDCGLRVTASGTPICENGNKNSTIHATVKGGKAPFTYLWNPGNLSGSTHVVTPTVTTTYTVIVSDSTGYKDTATAIVNVASKPVGSISGDTVICKGKSTTLTASGGSSYVWSTMETTPSITVSPDSSKSYTVIVSNLGCLDTVKTAILVEPSPVASATIISSGKSGTQLSASGGLTYNWIPQSGLSNPTVSDPLALPSESIQYCVYVTNTEGCVDSACVNVSVECNDLFVPTAFSPNNDGSNEMVCVLGNCMQTFLFTIYDRWGEKVFETNNLQVCWDGTYKGKPMNTAVFVYYLKATLANGQQLFKTGNISLIR